MTTSTRNKTRRELLQSGTADWVHLGEIHHQVQQNNPHLTVDQLQRETLDTIYSLAHDGLFEIGDLSGLGGGFAPWGSSLDAAIRRIAATYIGQFDNETAWLWVFWLGITEKGRIEAARAS